MTRSWLALLTAAALLGNGDEAIEVHFAPTGDRRLLESKISAEVGRARSEILVAMFHFTSERLARALAERRRAGVTVRILLDEAQSEASFAAALRGEGLDLRRVTPGGHEAARFHHKYCVIDTGTVMTGSYNWTVQGDRVNHENLVILRDGAAARSFRRDFESVWADRRLSRP